MDHELSLNNLQWERLAAYIEASEDQETVLKLLREDRQLVIEVITKE